MIFWFDGKAWDDLTIDEQVVRCTRLPFNFSAELESHDWFGADGWKIKCIYLSAQ